MLSAYRKELRKRVVIFVFNPVSEHQGLSIKGVNPKMLYFLEGGWRDDCF